MISRISHGEVTPGVSEEHRGNLNLTGTPNFRATGGVQALRRMERGLTRFLTLSFWGSLEKIEGFIGPDAERARYYPEDEEFLLGFEPTVGHYEVVVGP